MKNIDIILLLIIIFWILFISNNRGDYMNTFLIAIGFTLLACMMLVIFTRQEHIKNDLTEIKLKQNIIDNKINNLLNKNNNIKY